MTPHRRARVLIVEDEPRLRDLLCETLPDMGFDVQPARSAEEALRLLRDTPIDIVLLDLNLPAMDGLDFLEAFRQKQPHAPVIVMTGFGSLPAAQRAIRQGVTDFLTKPCHMGEIEAALERARRIWAEQREQEQQHTDTSKITEPPPGATLEEIETRAILAALERHGGNRSAAAAELGISRRTLYNRLNAARLQEDEENDR